MGNTRGTKQISDPVESVRDKKAYDIRSKFGDIFTVSEGCEEISHGVLDSFSDNVSAAGRLSLPSSIAFFRSIGAPDPGVHFEYFGKRSPPTLEIFSCESREKK